MIIIRDKNNQPEEEEFPICFSRPLSNPDELDNWKKHFKNKVIE